jgi:hypothetical protein
MWPNGVRWWLRSVSCRTAPERRLRRPPSDFPRMGLLSGAPNPERRTGAGPVVADGPIAGDSSGCHCPRGGFRHDRPRGMVQESGGTANTTTTGKAPVTDDREAPSRPVSSGPRVLSHVQRSQGFSPERAYSGKASSQPEMRLDSGQEVAGASVVQEEHPPTSCGFGPIPFAIGAPAARNCGRTTSPPCCRSSPTSRPEFAKVEVELRAWLARQPQKEGDA